MIVTIDFQGDRPIYEQLCRQIVEAVARGQLSPGEELPSVRQLGEQLGVNMHTIHKAYRWLKEEGYVVMDRRKGASLADPLPTKEENWDLRRKEELRFLLADGKNRGLGLEDWMKDLEEILEGFKGGK